MVLEVRKHLKPSQLVIQNSISIYNYAQKTNHWVVLAFVLLLAVFGTGPDPGLDPNGPECLEPP